METKVEISINICLKIIITLDNIFPIKNYMIHHQERELVIIFLNKDISKHHKEILDTLKKDFDPYIKKQGSGFQSNTVLQLILNI